MNTDNELSAEQLHRMAEDLVAVPGVEAVALGGSRARGTHTPTSDYDIGVYYDRRHLRVDELENRARAWANAPVSVAAPGEWGPWVDGGAWLHIGQSRVDWIFRDVERVGHQCRRARIGQFAFHSQAGHPLGFLDVGYAGEVASGRTLADPSGMLSAWRGELDPYPGALREALIQNTWQVEFDLECARKGADRGDSTYVALCASHAALICAHGWHAYANSWATNEKGLVANVERLPVDSAGFSPDTTAALAQVGASAAGLHRTIDRLVEVLGAATERLRA